MLPDPRSLELFLAVIDRGSITEGARAVGLSLPAASTRISALERGYGTTLLRRGRQGVSTTADGDILEDHARQLLTSARALERELAEHKQSREHTVRVASNTSAVDTLTEFLASTLARLPEVRIILDETSSVSALDRVQEGAADLAVASTSPEGRGLVSQKLWDDPLVAVVRPSRSGNDGQAAEESVSFSDVITQPMIGLTSGNPLQELIDRQAKSLGIEPHYRLRVPTLGAVFAVASTGAGAAIIPQGTASRLGASASSLRPLEESWTKRISYVAYRAETAEVPQKSAFIESLIRFAEELL